MKDAGSLGRMWSGFSSEIETGDVVSSTFVYTLSHVERLLI